MKRPVILAAAAAMLLGAGETAAQTATTVQLPTYSFFSVGTTVSVPDRGSVYMGGVNRSAMGPLI